MVKIKVISEKNTAIKNDSSWDKYSEVINQHNMMRSKYLKHKKVNENNHLTMYHFNESAFKKGAWNLDTLSARGLYLDDTNHVIARGFNKFFVLNERAETNEDKVIKKMISPDTNKIILSEKLDGFLIIVSYMPDKDDLLITSKANGEDYSNLAKDLLKITLAKNNHTLDELKEYIKEDYLKGNRYSLTFEGIDMKHDSHLVKYNEKKVVLLEVIANAIHNNTIIANNLPFNKRFDIRRNISAYFRLDMPNEVIITRNPNAYYKFSDNNGLYGLNAIFSMPENYDEAEGIIDSYLNSKEHFEGIVMTIVSDKEEFKVKIKTSYFRIIKQFRVIFERMINILSSINNKEEKIKFLNNYLNKELKNINLSKALFSDEIDDEKFLIDRIINKVIDIYKNDENLDDYIVWSKINDKLKKVNIPMTIKNLF